MIRPPAKTVIPLFIDPDEADYRETGRELIELFMAHLGEPKAEHDIVGFWTPKYLSLKLEKVRQADADTLYVVSEHLVCAGEDVGVAAGRVLWFKTGIHVYNVVVLVEAYAPHPTRSTRPAH